MSKVLIKVTSQLGTFTRKTGRDYKYVIIGGGYTPEAVKRMGISDDWAGKVDALGIKDLAWSSSIDLAIKRAQDFATYRKGVSVIDLDGQVVWQP